MSEVRGKSCSPDLIKYYVRTGRLPCVRTQGQRVRLMLSGDVEDLARTLADMDAARAVADADGG